eukprot:SAG31_NODE_373_length_16597_cov_21.519518_16_plen_88_part_00
MLKNTPPEMEEHAAIARVQELVNNVCTEINAEAGQADKRFQTFKMHDRLSMAGADNDDFESFADAKSFLAELVQPYRSVRICLPLFQ